MNTIYCKIESTNDSVIRLFTHLLNVNKNTTDELFRKALMTFPSVDNAITAGNVVITIIESGSWYVSFNLSNTSINTDDLYNWITGCGYEMTVDIVNDAPPINSEHVAIIELALATWECRHLDPEYSGNEYCEECTKVLSSMRKAIGEN